MNPELPPLDEGDLGRSYAFKRARKCQPTTRPCSTRPGAFEPVDD